MALNTTQRQVLRADFANRLCNRRDVLTITRAQLDTAIGAVDDWVEANATSFNNSLPGPIRTALTASQKAELLALVALKRYGG